MKQNDIIAAIGYLKDPIGKSATEHEQAVNIAVQALEKQVGKKLQYAQRSESGLSTGFCSVCEKTCSSFDRWCSKCGQKLNWEG